MREVLIDARGRRSSGRGGWKEGAEKKRGKLKAS